MSDCIFCHIVSGNIPSNKVYEDDDILAFHDLHPAAPTHVLIIPKKHIASLSEFPVEEEALAGKLLLRIQQIAKELGLQEEGYRVVNNMGELGGQTVHHIHFHLLGGRSLMWPPG
ncbi:histidine triad nucleotide-binding protein [Hazenella sp. IB182353]|uniref:histidine triad nucleotide-binding protein n=1 Tax=Polycladospora coralii TaxID=2771432 RepID=UPI001746BE29|nr:histidine triad nucleotide-binding protein [Polycladospora coralii]MBS7530102.1 histidine triad nucleotide-binding protein [Polycladospora coralii]